MVEVPKKILRDGNKMPVLGVGTYLGGGKDVSCALRSMGTGS